MITNHLLSIFIIILIINRYGTNVNSPTSQEIELNYNKKSIIRILNDTTDQDGILAHLSIGQKGIIYPRYAIFIDTTSGETLKTIDLLYDTNPFYNSGLEIAFIDGSNIYYKLPNGKNTIKHQIRKFLPAIPYPDIPEIIGEDFCMGDLNPIINDQGNFLTVRYAFECIGLSREYIHGDYCIMIHEIFNQDGKRILEWRVDGCQNPDPNDEHNLINSTGDFACLRYNLNRDDIERSITVTEIINIKSEKQILIDTINKPNFSATNFWIWYESNNIPEVFGIINYEDKLHNPTEFVKALIIDRKNSTTYLIEKPAGYTYDWRNNSVIIQEKFFGLINIPENDTTKIHYADLNPHAYLSR